MVDSMYELTLQFLASGADAKLGDIPGLFSAQQLHAESSASATLADQARLVSKLLSYQ